MLESFSGSDPLEPGTSIHVDGGEEDLQSLICEEEMQPLQEFMTIPESFNRSNTEQGQQSVHKEMKKPDSEQLGAIADSDKRSQEVVSVLDNQISIHRTTPPHQGAPDSVFAVSATGHNKVNVEPCKLSGASRERRATAGPMSLNSAENEQAAGRFTSRHRPASVPYGTHHAESVLITPTLAVDPQSGLSIGNASVFGRPRDSQSMRRRRWRRRRTRSSSNSPPRCGRQRLCSAIGTSSSRGPGSTFRRRRPPARVPPLTRRFVLSVLPVGRQASSWGVGACDC